MKKIFLFVMLFLSILSLSSCINKKRYKINLYEKPNLTFKLEKDFRSFGEETLFYVYYTKESYTLYRFAGYKKGDSFEAKYYVCGAGRTSDSLDYQTNTLCFEYDFSFGNEQYSWSIGYYQFYPQV